MLILFDYDGVIVDSFAPLLALCIEAQGSIGHGRAPLSDDLRTIENLTFQALGRLIGIPENRIAAYSDKVFELQARHWHPAPFPGVVRALSLLASRNVLAVVTASRSEPVMASLQDFGLGGAISMVRGGELGRSKAESISAVRSSYAAVPGETAMVGDAVSDIRAGKEAGVRTVAVSWGFQDRELLLREAPDILIEDPEELLTVESRCINWPRNGEV